MGMMDKRPAKGQSGEREPKGVTSSDTKSERRERMVGGVGMGKEDNTGSDKQFNTGRTSGICYSHVRSEYR